MNRYVKGKSVIFATEKAYNALYKEQGFVPADENMDISTVDNEELETVKAELETTKQFLTDTTTELETVKAELETTKQFLTDTTTELETVKKEKNELTENVNKLTEENENLKAELAKKNTKSKKEDNKENE